jgi:hypothetical protein
MLRQLVPRPRVAVGLALFARQVRTWRLTAVLCLATIAPRDFLAPAESFVCAVAMGLLARATVAGTWSWGVVSS